MIGIFDSGLGGLTALKEIRRLTPGEELIYFGDTGRVPYGTRSNETIIKYALQDTAFLRSKGVDAIVIACGTVSTTALEELKKAHSLPIIDVVAPASEAAVKVSRNKRIGVIGTGATIRSGAFEAEITRLDKDAQVFSRACPLLVPLVENGFTSPDCEITRLACEHYLKDIRNEGIDTLVLGCTHYPIISDIIASLLPGVTLISTGAEAAKRLTRVIGVKEGSSPVHYYVSDDPKMFLRSASAFLGEDLSGKVEQIDIEKY